MTEAKGSMLMTKEESGHGRNGCVGADETIPVLVGARPMLQSLRGRCVGAMWGLPCLGELELAALLYPFGGEPRTLLEGCGGGT